MAMISDSVRLSRSMIVWTSIPFVYPREPMPSSQQSRSAIPKTPRVRVVHCCHQMQLSIRMGLFYSCDCLPFSHQDQQHLTRNNKLRPYQWNIGDNTPVETFSYLKRGEIGTFGTFSFCHDGSGVEEFRRSLLADELPCLL